MSAHLSTSEAGTQAPDVKISTNILVSVLMRPSSVVMVNARSVVILFASYLWSWELGPVFCASQYLLSPFNFHRLHRKAYHSMDPQVDIASEHAHNICHLTERHRWLRTPHKCSTRKADTRKSLEIEFKQIVTMQLISLSLWLGNLHLIIFLTGQNFEHAI